MKTVLYVILWILLSPFILIWSIGKGIAKLIKWLSEIDKQPREQAPPSTIPLPRPEPHVTPVVRQPPVVARPNAPPIYPSTEDINLIAIRINRLDNPHFTQHRLDDMYDKIQGVFKYQASSLTCKECEKTVDLINACHQKSGIEQLFAASIYHTERDGVNIIPQYEMQITPQDKMKYGIKDSQNNYYVDFLIEYNGERCGVELDGQKPWDEDQVKRDVYIRSKLNIRRYRSTRILPQARWSASETVNKCHEVLQDVLAHMQEPKEYQPPREEDTPAWLDMAE